MLFKERLSSLVSGKFKTRILVLMDRCFRGFFGCLCWSCSTQSTMNEREVK